MRDEVAIDGTRTLSRLAFAVSWGDLRETALRRSGIPLDAEDRDVEVEMLKIQQVWWSLRWAPEPDQPFSEYVIGLQYHLERVYEVPIHAVYGAHWNWLVVPAGHTIETAPRRLLIAPARALSAMPVMNFSPEQPLTPARALWIIVQRLHVFRVEFDFEPEIQYG